MLRPSPSTLRMPCKVWDVALRDGFDSHRPKEFGSLAAAMVTFRYDDASSFSAAKRWVAAARALGEVEAAAQRCFTLCLVPIASTSGNSREVDAGDAAEFASAEGVLLIEARETRASLDALFAALGAELRAKAGAMREKLQWQEGALARLDAAMHPKGWPLRKVDPDALWRAIEAAKEAAVRPEAIGKAEEKLRAVNRKGGWGAPRAKTEPTSTDAARTATTRSTASEGADASAAAAAGSMAAGGAVADGAPVAVSHCGAASSAEAEHTAAWRTRLAASASGTACGPADGGSSSALEPPLPPSALDGMAADRT
eukprot:3352202-Prymnesium_polylepis.1